ncbi:hypothetical protein FQA39_LY05086 [Lamprigera yunnana]|nr:hypothetical protein FQA39_LY05086 [Lamprigera yunnana]
MLSKSMGSKANVMLMRWTAIDSVSTSFIQLAKKRILKYSDPKYNINDFKTGDCETIVGLYYPFEFASIVKIFGKSKQYILFKKEEWIQFPEQRENINKYFQTCDMIWKPRQIGSKTLTFEMIEEKKILRIEDMCGNEVYLSWESVSEVWSLETVLSCRLSYSSASNFKHFYDDVVRAVVEMSGDANTNIYNIVTGLPEKSDDVCCMLEFIKKKMWMLYAEQRWTKAIDLKSAVELYMKSSALKNLTQTMTMKRFTVWKNIKRFNNMKSSGINIRLEGKYVESS